MSSKKQPASKGAGKKRPARAPEGHWNWAAIERDVEADSEAFALFFIDPEYVPAIRGAWEQRNFKHLLRLLRQDGVNIPGVIHPALLPLLAELISPLAKRKGSSGARTLLTDFDDGSIRSWYDFFMSKPEWIGRGPGQMTKGQLYEYLAKNRHVDSRTIIRSLKRTELTKPRK